MINYYLTDKNNTLVMQQTNNISTTVDGAHNCKIDMLNIASLTYLSGGIQKTLLQAVCVSPMAVDYILHVKGCLDGTNYYDLIPKVTHGAAATELVYILPNLIFQFPIRIEIEAAVEVSLKVYISLKEFGGTNL